MGSLVKREHKIKIIDGGIIVSIIVNLLSIPKCGNRLDLIYVLTKGEKRNKYNVKIGYNKHDIPLSTLAAFCSVN